MGYTCTIIGLHTWLAAASMITRGPDTANDGKASMMNEVRKNSSGDSEVKMGKIN